VTQARSAERTPVRRFVEPQVMGDSWDANPRFDSQINRAFASIQHPADTCAFYASTIGEPAVEAFAHDHLTFTVAALNNTVNCILFTADIVFPHSFFEPEVRPPACRVHNAHDGLFPEEGVDCLAGRPLDGICQGQNMLPA
jgi:hypothetical protein